MSEMNSDSNLFAISFGKDMSKSDSFNPNAEEMDENFDAFNDETFGGIDSTDWESEHEKLMSFGLESNPKDNKTDLNKNSFNKNNSLNESRAEDDIHFGFDDIVVKSISNLGLEDEEDFEDPAIMTFARSKPINMNAMADQTRRLSRSSPPPPAILSYEEYSASPKTHNIWSATQMDTTLTQTVSSSGCVNMRTLEDIENDLINRNSDQLTRLSTIQRPIKMEDLEANLMNDSSSPQSLYNRMHQMSGPEKGWSPFGTNSMHEFLPNGRIYSELMPNAVNIEKNRTDREMVSNLALMNRRDDRMDAVLQQAAQQVIRSAATEPTHGLNKSNDKDIALHFASNGAQVNEPALKRNTQMDPLLKAQTLTEIERQLIANQSSPQKQNMSQNTTQPQTEGQLHNMGPQMAQVVQQIQNKPQLIPQLTHQIRPQMLAQNRMNSPYNRPPVMHLMGRGLHPAIGRTLFSPALIPNSQRIFPFPMQSHRPIMHPLLHPLHMQQQQHLNQTQRHSHQSHQHFRHPNRYYDNNYNEDEYSGLMTPREKEWLIRIQQMQTELKDPYVDDYYYVTYISRKIAAKAANDKENKTTPSLLLPERPKPVIEPENSKYIPVQFEGSLGKIQVSNVNCPRKLLDCKLNKGNVNSSDSSSDRVVINKSEVQRFRKLLLEIEKLYVVLINIDDEDKRIGALPEEARKPHLDTRQQLCDKLFKGLTNETNDKINLDVAQIKKGLALMFRSISYLGDENQRGIIISDLLNANNFRHLIIKPKDRLDWGQMLVNAILTVSSIEVILKIVNNINNISVVIKSEYGQRIIEALVNQCEKQEINEENKSKWSIFVNYVLDEADDLPELRQLCRNHLTKFGF